ncbi:MAG: hypothetical protein R2875_11685 [Desulfobacterales bacterium]
MFFERNGLIRPGRQHVSYSWTQTFGPKVALINPNSATPYFEAPTDNTAAQTFGFRLLVTDNGGLQSAG